MIYSGHTHSVDYTPQNCGRDWVTARCGETVHVREFSAEPTCKACRVVLMRERLWDKRSK